MDWNDEYTIIVNWFNFQVENIYSERLKILVQRYEKWLERNGYYVENWSGYSVNLNRQ